MSRDASASGADRKTCRIKSSVNHFDTKVLPMCQE